jgi:hypothetical protein
MHRTTTYVPVICTEFFDNDHRTVGKHWKVPTGNGSSTWLTEAHDWNNGRDAETFVYDPVTLGAYDDPTQAEREINDRVPSDAPSGVA